jgi:hypothetical protein
MNKSQLTRVYIYPKFRSFSRKKNRVFSAVDDRKGLKTLSKKGCPIKNYSVSERGELGLSSHAFISISIFLTKTDFFEGGGALRRINLHLISDRNTDEVMSQLLFIVNKHHKKILKALLLDVNYEKFNYTYVNEILPINMFTLDEKIVKKKKHKIGLEYTFYLIFFY